MVLGGKVARSGALCRSLLDPYRLFRSDHAGCRRSARARVTIKQRGVSLDSIGENSRLDRRRDGVGQR